MGRRIGFGLRLRWAFFGAAGMAALALGSAALAGSGVGGIFNLGQLNTVNAQTTLRGSTNTPQLAVQNQNTGANAVAVQGIGAGATGAGVVGQSPGTGVRGTSPNVLGVFGISTGGTGVRGQHAGTTGTQPGVEGRTNSTDAGAVAVLGSSSSATGFGGRFDNTTAGAGTSGTGLVALGRSHTLADNALGGDGFSGGIEASGPNGVEGNSHTPGGFGVSGDAPAVGVRGAASDASGVGGFFTGGSTGTGVSANGGATGVSASGGTTGVDVNVAAAGAVGVKSTAGSSANDAFQATTANTVGDGFQAVTTGSAAFGVFSISSGGGVGVVSSSGTGTAVAASNSNSTNATVTAFNGAAGGTAGTFTGSNALRVRPNAVIGTTGLTADMTGDVNGDGNASNDAANAIFAAGDDTNNNAVITSNTLSAPTCDEFTCEAIETSGFVDVNGNARVTGTLTKGAGAFEIDHPLDPQHYYLRHSFVESPDMKNVYDGIVTTDGDGRATVVLPDYFGALNGDFRYQLTIVGATFAQAIVAREIPEGGRSFVIRTDKPGVKVSWQVTGIRKDAYALAHRIKVVERKSGPAANMYLHPELFGHAGERPLGLDVPAARDTDGAQVAQSQAELQALVQRKRTQALAEAARAPKPVAPRDVSQQSQK